MAYRDTTIQVTLNNNIHDAPAFLAFKKAVNNDAQLNGSFKTSTVPTGSWTYIYFASNAGEVTEVTSDELRNSFLGFGQIVKDKIK